MIACSGGERATSALQNAEVIVGDPQLIAGLLPLPTSVKWVQSTWAGVRPLLAAGPQPFELTSVRGVFGAQMTEFVMGYLLAHSLRMDRRKEAQRERRWDDASSGGLAGKCLGILGTGSIARHLAEVAAGFELNTRGLNRSGSHAAGFGSVFSLDKLEEFLRDLDFLVSILPDTPATTHLLNSRTLAMLPAHAVLINVGRANVVDTQALRKALKRDELAGAVLDVFDTEPLPASDPLWDTPGLVITAHIAARSAPELIAPVFLENYDRYLNGEPLLHLVDFDRGY